MCDIRSFEVAKYKMRIQVQGDKRKRVYILCEHKQIKDLDSVLHICKVNFLQSAVFIGHRGWRSGRRTAVRWWWTLLWAAGMVCLPEKPPEIGWWNAPQPPRPWLPLPRCPPRSPGNHDTVMFPVIVHKWKTNIYMDTCKFHIRGNLKCC